MSTIEEFHPPAASAWQRCAGACSFSATDLLIVAIILVVLLAFLLPSMIVTIPAGHLGVLWNASAAAP